MGLIMLGVGDLGASNKPGDIIKTMALGSCIAVIMLDPTTRTVGMVHVALPDSSVNTSKALEKPGYFADTGIPALISAMTVHGKHNGNNRDFIAKLVGGARILDSNNTFNIGKRNALAIKKILWKRCIGIVSEDIGGTISRTVAVDARRGRVIVSSPGLKDWSI